MRRLLTISFTRANIDVLIERLEEKKVLAGAIRDILTSQRDQCFNDAAEDPHPTKRAYGEVDKAVKSYVTNKLHYVTFRRFNAFYNTYMRIIDVIMDVFDKVGLKPARRNHFDITINIDEKRNRDIHELYRGQAAFSYLAMDRERDVRTGIVYWIVNLNQYGSHLGKLLEETNTIEDKLDAMEAMLDLYTDHAATAKELLDVGDKGQEIHFPAEPLNKCLDGIVRLRDTLISSEDR
ncbi:MAG: hypothetical protein CMF35_01970 [Leeuwenhoekiella sp.]|jgi:hypothetical protein|nr:hypothetical protein [Leeuwenhoekiella sp.]MBQ50459.1 hypothetical protein [Leeuwenhoekiella sp.]|tara:strand:+ start:3307 stop:4014 length:708 start_codon:yes stop_codon:yes gene_type:complete